MCPLALSHTTCLNCKQVSSTYIQKSCKHYILILALFQRHKERFVVLEDFKSKDKDHLSVKKGEVVLLVSNRKHDKNWRYVCNATADKLGLVPAKILKKEPNNNVEGW